MIESKPAPTPNAGYSLTSLVGLGLRARVEARRRKLSDIAMWKRDTCAIQARQLRSNLIRSARTRIGLRSDFLKIAAINDDAEMIRAYRSVMPVRDWYAFKDDIADMREGGEPDVLWSGRVDRFAQTSGTTAGDKYIPVSDEMMRSNYLASLDIFAHLINRGVHPERIMGGRCLFLGGSTDLSYNEHGIATGDLSGLVTPLIKWPLSEIYSPGPEIALLSEWTEKIESMAQLTIGQDIRFISGMPSWAMVLIDRVVELARERGADARCARDVWPNLEVFVHGGVKYTPFIPRMNSAFSGDPSIDFPCRHELYPASEGFIAQQDLAGDPGMRLMSDTGIFFEFVPREEIEDENPRALSCWEVEKGQQYVVVMSTNAGLWRYIIGDVVEFDSIPDGFDGRGGDGACRLRIVGRHTHFINAFGENLIGEHIELGVSAAARETGLEIGEFTASPIYPSETTRSGLELAIEFAHEPSAEELARVSDGFDRAVRAVNVDYNTKRTDSLGMAPPVVTALPMGTFHRWLESRGKLGGQSKCPRCANHREIIEAIKGFGTLEAV